MKIYVDMLFAINFSMDFISFFITEMLMRRKINKKRMLLASVIGGTYGVFEVLSSLHTLISIIVSILVSVVMCMIAYYEKSPKRFCAMYAIHWGVSACLGGFMSVLYSFLNDLLSEYIENYSYEEVYTGARFFIILALAIIASIAFGRIFSKEKSISSVQINVTMEEKEYSLTALCDSGNLLNEPISGKAVILVTEKSELGTKINTIPEIFKRFIPYKSAGGGGMLKGIIPQKIVINEQECSAIIAPISNTDFAGYEACVPASLIV